MQQLATSLLCAFLLFGTAHANEKDFHGRAEELYQQEKYTEALEIVDEGIEHLGPTDELIHLKYKVLLALEKYESALETFELIIQRVGDSPDVVIDKVRLLMKLERYEEALDVALSVDEKSDDKSPYMSLFVTRIYVALGDKEKALDWLATSMDRGDRSYDYLMQEEFGLLHSDAGFQNIIKEMKSRAGIGKPAADFSVRLLSGANYSLSQDKGKVILMDFWATWCPPCVAEFPRLKEIYADLNAKGFEIIGISLDSNTDALESFIEEKDLPWNIVFSGKGMDDEVAHLYGVDSAPRYVLVDRKGILRHASETGGKKLEERIMELVSQ